MALYHLTVSQIRRSAGQSAIAAAAYRAGECLYSDYYGEYSDYTRKGGVICSEILLPPHAPLEYQDRATLWNTVEQVEKHKKAQLAYSFDISKTRIRPGIFWLTRKQGGLSKRSLTLPFMAEGRPASHGFWWKQKYPPPDG